MKRTDEDEVVALINRMMAQGRRRERRYAAAAAVLGVLAVSASVGGWLAYDTARRGQELDATLVMSHQQAVETVESIAGQVADDVGSLAERDAGRLGGLLAATHERVNAFFAETDPRDPQRLVRRGDLLARFAAAYLRLGETTRALDAARTAREVLEERSATELSAYGGHRALATALLAEGDALSDTGEPDAALAAYSAAAELHESLAEGEPPASAPARRLALAYERRAQALLRTGEAAAGAALLEDVIAMREATLVEMPDDREAASELVVAYSNLADHRAHTGAHEAAIDLYDRLVATLDGFAPEGDGDAGWRELKARHVARSGRVALAAGDGDDARARLSRARESYGEMLAAAPEDGGLEAGLADVLDLLGEVHLRGGDLPAARAALMESLEIRRARAENAAAGAASRRAFAQTLIALAKVDRAENLDEPAQARVDEALAILRDAVAANPDSVAAAIDLARGLRDASEFGGTSRLSLEEAQGILQRLDAGDELPERDRPLLTDIVQRIGSPSQ